MHLHDPPVAARHAGLRYMTDASPGYTRRRRGRGFVYLSPTGARVTARHLIRRFESLAIPPAWTRVWICPDSCGHLQATGHDAKGRKQYRYHPDWTTLRNQHKFDTLAEFGHALPAIRGRVDRDLRRPGLPKEKVAACIVHLLDRALIRIGNSEYARDNDSYGLTTIRNGHAKVAGAEVRFNFKAKSGRLCVTSIESPRAARIVRACQDLPGQELFGYLDDGGRTRDIGSSDINEYLAAITGRPFTAKDFRTWGGTCVAAEALNRAGPPRRRDGSPPTAADLKQREVMAIRAAAEVLCNTTAVCRKFYVHPALFQLDAAGRLHAAFTRAAAARARRLSTTERTVLSLLRPAGARKAAA